MGLFLFHAFQLFVCNGCYQIPVLLGKLKLELTHHFKTLSSRNT